ncbi:hypothetical protein FJ492_27510 [Mesorhizobium sp. B2-5-4]|uniref:hypothetical protein n=1 Tax=Mesorhizobium sp. B2-5-4 TaxID=2589926 RepID=UPI00112950B0|nr:hypothetical protein [Mesorhizobium sp. B2-5-4]TPK32474.1 hypothetical protein FJ492_27510 [Mesorhizobium sp. B2-5-4]
MRELILASQLHAQLDTDYARKLFRSTVRNHQHAIARYTELRRINDGAYFLIIFGTFERYITDRADTAVKARAGKPLFRHRRAWETLLNGTKLQTSFLNRVRVLLDMRSQNFTKIADYYAVRNDLAHEGITAKVFSIPTVVADLQTAINSLRS